MIVRSPEQLKSLLAEQIGFIKKSCAAYDEGDKNEAKRLTTHIDILVHDRGKTLSLLSQMGKLKELKFFSPKHDYRPGNMISEVRLCKMAISSEYAAYIPHLEDVTIGWNQSAFSRWWEEPIIIIRGKEAAEFSRKKLVCMMRDKDGGAHLDKVIPEHYTNLASGQAIGWQFTNNKESYYLNAPHYASVRHIAHEVLKTVSPLL